MSDDLIEVLERTVINQIDSLNHFIIDLRMVQEFMDYYSVGMLEIEEFDQRQMRMTRIKVRHEQLLALRQVLTTHIVKPKNTKDIHQKPKDSTILNQFLTEEVNLQEVLASGSINLATACGEFVLSQLLCIHPNEFHPSNVS